MYSKKTVCHNFRTYLGDFITGTLKIELRFRYISLIAINNEIGASV
jgi:hypothetical protein